jgi:predicted chitinase
LPPAMENKFFISLLGTFLLLAYPNTGSPDTRETQTTAFILQNIDPGELNEEQLEILRDEMKIYQQALEPLRQTDMKAWAAKIKEMFRKLGEGFKIYRLSQSNPDLKNKAEEFTRQTNVEVYILSYVEDAFLNNIFYRIAEARYDMMQRAHVKMKYQFKKATTNSSSKFTVKLDLVYDSALVDLLKEKLSGGYTEYSDQTLEASANKELLKAGIQDIFSDASTENSTVVPTAGEILDKLASAEVMALEEDLLLVNICDSLARHEKIYYWNKDCSLKIKMKNKDTVGVKEINLGLTIDISNSKNDQSFPFVIKDFINWNTLKLDSLPEGKYIFTATINKKPQKKIFYLRKNKPEYACMKCGRDLTVTLKRLENIFPKNDQLSFEDAILFNTALKKAGFNTCKKQIHFFSQVRCESANFTKFKESAEYSLPRYLFVFHENCNVKGLFSQSFWDKRTYKKYFFNKVYEEDTLSKKNKYLAKEIKTHSWTPKCLSAVKESKDTIQCPISFSTPSKEQKGSYILVTYSELQKAEVQKRLFSLTYANMIGNGDSSTHDGYNFFGKGALQLTGRANYKDVSLKANKIYGTSFDWVTNYKEIAEKRDAIIYSATAFFIYRVKDLNILDKSNVEQTTKLVNGGSNGLKERKEFYNDLINTDLYDCEIPSN